MNKRKRKTKGQQSYLRCFFALLAFGSRAWQARRLTVSLSMICSKMVDFLSFLVNLCAFVSMRPSITVPIYLEQEQKLQNSQIYLELLGEFLDTFLALYWQRTEMRKCTLKKDLESMKPLIDMTWRSFFTSGVISGVISSPYLTCF